jgi:hypothetical protein
MDSIGQAVTGNALAGSVRTVTSVYNTKGQPIEIGHKIKNSFFS